MIEQNLPRKRFSAIFLILLSVAIGLSFTGCDSEESDTVDQDKIYTQYLLYYNENKDVTYARAWFKFSDQLGEHLELVSPSKVTFNGDQLPWQETLSYYEKEYAGFVSSGTFKWTDTDGNTYTNKISTDTTRSLPASIDTIPRNSSYTLTWSGSSLGQNESIQVNIDGENEGDTKIFNEDDSGSTNIVLPKDDLQDIGHGPGEMKVDWRSNPELKEKTSAGGWIKGRYRPANRQVFMD